MAEYNIEDFINVEDPKVEKDVKLKRFNSPFKIKALGAGEISNLRKRATTKKLNKKTHQYENETDQNKFNDLLIVESVVFPSLTDERLQKRYNGFGDPVQTLGNMLLAGEYTKLVEEITALSDLDPDEDPVEEAKN